MEREPLIMIVDPDVELAHQVADSFKQWGAATLHAACGREALQAVIAGRAPDLILLELTLDDLQGTEVCRELRERAATRLVPIVFFAARASEMDRVVAFEVGADDCIAKPCSLRELTLRVRGLLRRASASEPVRAAGESRFERLCLNLEAHQVWIDGAEVILTALEFRLLHTLVSRRGLVQTRSQLLEDVWGMHGDLCTRAVDTQVKRVREKLGQASGYIETIRGVGYRFQRNSRVESETRAPEMRPAREVREARERALR